jgi:transcriptional regulator with XRE-family HTH domain
MTRKNNLREIRVKLGITQQAISSMTGFTQGQICEWEKGKKVISTDTAVRIANALNISLDELIVRD